MTRHTARKVPGHRRARQSDGGRRRHPPVLAIRAVLALLVLAGWLAGAACGASGSGDAPAGDGGGDTVGAGTAAGGESGGKAGGDAAAQPAADSAPIALGVDVLFRDSLQLVRGGRVGLITNHTGLSWVGGRAVSTIDRLYQDDDVELAALFSPEHGIRGDVDRPVTSAVDEQTGLPIHSLYGDTRKPTPEMLNGLDILVFDIQDIGTRYYSYVWTMTLAMEAAAEQGLRFVVLDRPDPIGGLLVQGNVAPSYSPVAYYEAAMRHGMTAGELARYVNGEYALGADLHVVPMVGWKREMWWEDTGIPWRPPSPNMPSVESATHYPGTCLFEGTNLSVGRGTPRAFQQWGAPWLDAEAVAAALRDRGFPGVAIEAVTFTPGAPTDGKYDGATVHGIRLTVTDRAIYDPVPVAVAALLEITRRHPAAFRWREGWFDGLAGGSRLREQIRDGTSLDEITAPWAEQRAAFRDLRDRYLLY